MTKRLFTIGILMFFSLILTAQEKELNAADKAFTSRDYTAAVKYYKKVLRKTNDFELQKNVAYRIGLSYYKMGDYRLAENWLADAVGNRIDSLKAYLLYANILAVENRHEDAINILYKALKIAPHNERIQSKITANKILMEAKKADTFEIVKEVTALNSPYSDYSVGWWNDKLVFASTRSIAYGRSMDGRTGQGFSKLYYAAYDPDINKWSNVAEMPGKLRTPYNDGAFVYDSINRIGYWTSCNERNHRCLIYQSAYNKYKKQWQKAGKASFMLDGYNYGHVAVANGGKTLYFVSNMPGGFGENDIWKITRDEDGNWGIPVNLGEEINTPYNEMFPTIAGDTLLFFSSEGDDSYGGLDLYAAIKSNLGFSKPIHLNYPFNTAADDFSMVLNQSATRGYFCSNRNPETGDDIYTFNGFPVKLILEGTVTRSPENLPVKNVLIVLKNGKGVTDSMYTDKDGKYRHLIDAFDEYRITASYKKYYDEKRTFNTCSVSLLSMPPPQKVIDFVMTKRRYTCGISGLITDRATRKPMPDVKVRIYDKTGFSTYVTTDTTGHYVFKGLKPNTIYTVKTGKPGYFSESRVCTLPRVEESKIFSKANGYDMDFELTGIKKDAEIILNNIYYDFDKATLRETSKIELNKLASMLKETPNVVVQISAHTDTRGSAEYNLKLSAARAKSVVDYLISKGIDRSRLIAKGYGESKPLIPNAQTEEQHQANRRTTFKVVDINHPGKTIADTEKNKNTIVYTQTGGEGKEVPGLVYHIQLITSSRNLNPGKDFSKVKSEIPEIKIYKIPYGRLYKYEAGEASTLADARALQKILRLSGYRDCFIVPYYKGKKITIQKAELLEKGGRQ